MQLDPELKLCYHQYRAFLLDPSVEDPSGIPELFLLITVLTPNVWVFPS